MKKLLLAFLLLGCTSTVAIGQLTIGYHQSGFLPFATIGYELGDRFVPEVRLGTNLDLEEATAFELALLYQFMNKSDYEVYVGLAPGYYNQGSFALPIGLNIYPLEAKRFGLHIEVAPLLIGEGATILRGSWGIRYRFGE